MSLGRTILTSKSNFLFHLEDNCRAVASGPKPLLKRKAWRASVVQTEGGLGLDSHENPPKLHLFSPNVFHVMGDSGAQNSGGNHLLLLLPQGCI